MFLHALIALEEMLMLCRCTDVVLVDCLGGTNYILNLFWGIVLN